MELNPNTFLLILLNLSGALLTYLAWDTHNFIKETRKKLDRHVEDWQLHGLERGGGGGGVN